MTLVLIFAQLPHLLLAQTASPDAIQRKAAEVVNRPEFQTNEGLSEESQAIWQLLLTWLIKPFLWLYKALGGLPPFLKIVVIVVLTIILIALITHIAWSIIVAIRGQEPRLKTAGSSRVQDLDPADLETRAREAAGSERYIEAIRLLFKAALLRIERAQKRKFRAGITNRELLRRYQTSSVGSSLEHLINTIDHKWYGDEDCGATDYESCLSEHHKIRQVTGGMSNDLRS